MPTTITKTIRASGGDYTTLSAWEAALPASLVANDECHVAECYNDWPSGLNDAVTISGPTTDATRFIKVTVAEGHGHGGLPDVGFYLINSVSSNTPNTTVDGLRVKRSGYCFLPGIDSPTNVFQNCLAQTTSNTYAFATTHTNNHVYPRLINCIAIGNGTGIGYYQIFHASRLRAAAYNCVAANYATGFVTGGSDIKNCIAFNCTTGFNGTARTTSASSDGTGNITGITSADFVDSANGDFHLAPGSALIGAGTNLYSDFTTDIDGDTRPSSGAWDIGFDHYVAVGGGITVDGAALSLTHSLTQGSATGAASVAGAALTQTVIFAPGTASAGASVSVSGASLTQSLTLAAGSATGAALASGANLGQTLSLTPGSVSAGGAVSVSGASLTQTLTFSAGTATGAALINGISLAQSVALMAGTVSIGITAPGAALTINESLSPGTATGAASVAGAALTQTMGFVGGVVTVPGVGATVKPRLINAKARTLTLDARARTLTIEATP